jgi:hypothetical protein
VHKQHFFFLKKKKNHGFCNTFCIGKKVIP